MLRRKPLDRSGVSEVVGTILILLITVIIFSSIILWVYTIPTPTATGRVSFSGNLTGIYDAGSWKGAYINLTHLGGDNLLEGNTRVYLTIDNRTDALKTRGTIFDGFSLKDYGVSGADDHWNIGEVWSYLNESIPQTAAISVMVVDIDRGVVLWQDNLLGAEGANAPVFIDKWVDSNPSTATRDAVKAGDTFTLYAKVIDPDGDLNPGSVWAYLTFGSGAPLGSVQLLDNGDSVVGDKVAQDGIFTRALSYSVLQSWDGGIIILNATDFGGRQIQTRLTLRIGEATSGGGSTGPITLGVFGFGSEGQRYDIFEESDWDANGWNATSARAFIKGQGVVIVVVSQYLKNAELMNRVYLQDQSVLPVKPVVYGNAPYNDPVGNNTRPSSNRAFTYLGFLDDFYVYEYRFKTSSAAYGFDGVQLRFGYYSVDIEMLASAVRPPLNRFATVDTIAITDTDGSLPAYPKLEFFRDAAHTQPSSTFNSTDVLYVKVTVMDTEPGVSVGDVVISDNFGGVPVWAVPGSPPVSTVSVNGSTSYAFNVDLAAPNLDEWLFGLNSYGFRIKRISDSNEEYTLSKQLNIRGPRWKLDAITALNEFTVRWFGADETWYSTFYENDAFWSRTVVESFRDECVGIWCFIFGDDPPWGGGDFLDVALGDLDEDGDLDAVFGLEAGRVFWYRNALGTGTKWERYEIDDLGVRVQAVAIGKIDRDTDNDVVAGASNGQIWYYTNDGRWTPSLIEDLPTAVNTIKVADVTGDGFNDIIAGTQAGEIRIYRNNGFGVFGTQQTSDYLLAADLPVQGTVSGTYVNTQSDNDVYQSITEVLGPGESLELYLPNGEQVAPYEDAPIGSYLDVLANDGRYETLRELHYQFVVWDRWLIRSSSNGQPPGHRFFWTSSPPGSLGPGDTAFLVIDGYISQGTEPMEIHYCTTCGTRTFIDYFSDRDETTKIFNLTAKGYTGGSITIIVQDSDESVNENGPLGDKRITEFSIDYMSILVYRQSGTTSRLQHQWRTQTIGSGGTAYKAFLQAHHSEGVELEDFRFQWATAQTGPWNNLFVVQATSDNDLYQSATLPTTVGGLQLYIRVIDMNRTGGATELDTIYVDHFHISRFITIPDVQVVSVGTAVRDMVIGDMDNNGDLDIVIGAGSNARIYYGPSWGVSRTLAATGTVYTVDIGYINGDNRLDVVTGSSDGSIYWFVNDAGWARTQLTSMNSAVNAVRVGDVDGDYWDDIILGTASGYIRLFRHDRGIAWVVEDIDKLETAILALDIGDVDRGVVIDPAQYGS